MLNKEHQLLMPLITRPWKRFTFREIKEFSKKTSKSYVSMVLKKNTKEKIIKEEKVGNLHLYKLNHHSIKARIYAGFIAEHLAWNKLYLPYLQLQKVAAKVPTLFYVLIITGSYVKNTQKKTSDIDVVIIIDNTEDTKRVYAQLKSICELSIPEIHLYVFKKSEFLGMLINKEANYGKEIAKNNLLLYGAEIYYQIIDEAIEHGFNGENLS